MKKRLRILQNSELDWDLSPGTYLIDSTNADIVVAGWKAAACALTVSDIGHVAIKMPALVSDPRCGQNSEADGDAAETILLQDFVPMRLGGVVLCTGPVGSWPANAALLAMLPPEVADSPKVEKGRLLPVIAVLICTAIGVIAMMLFVFRPPDATGPSREGPKADSTADAARRLASALRAAGLDVTLARDALVVRGVVATTDDGRRIRQAVESSRVANVFVQYDVADNDIAIMKAMPALSKASFRYLGDGKFSVAVPVKDRAQAGSAIDELSRDYLSTNVKSITLDAAGPDANAASAAVGASVGSTGSDADASADPEVVDAGYLTYRTKADGTKEIISIADDDHPLRQGKHTKPHRHLGTSPQ